MLNFDDMQARPLAHPARAAIAAVACAAACTAVLGLGACLAPPRDRGPLLAPGPAEARAHAEALLAGAVARDGASVRAQLCPALQAQPLLAPGEPLAIDAFSIAAIEPVWVGGEPAFHVAVELVQGGARLPRGLRVRAREGCVDQLLDAAPVGAQPPAPGEISL